jgi:hypothetical protein
LAERFETTFGRELEAALADVPQADSQLEVFSYFIRTGALPWWADLSDRRLLEASLQNLIQQDPVQLRRALKAVPDEEQTRRRIARSFPDHVLDDLTGVFTPSLSAAFAGLGTAWLAILEQVGGARGYAAHVTRIIWWEEVLRAASVDTQVSSAPRFFRAVLTRVARRLGTDYRLLLEDLRRTLHGLAVPVQPWVRDLAERLWREIGDDTKRTRESASPPESTVPSESAVAQLMRLIERLDAFHAEIWRRLFTAMDPLPERLQEQAIVQLERAALEAPQPRSRGGTASSEDVVNALVPILHTAFQKKLIAPELGANLLDALPGSATSKRLYEDLVKTLRDAPRAARPAGQEPSELKFSDADELYLANAGLVLLWPFLENFFMRLGLTQEKRFKHEAAAQRAVGLLQYVADASESPPEFLLPLNKALCGLAPEEVFDFGPEITAIEMDECNDLLSAVIQQAPVLRDMSIAGFRGSFLLREGQLSTRDGNWLLRVERETHDVVLDRFPWGFGIVKLPWMQAMMQVEW